MPTFRRALNAIFDRALPAALDNVEAARRTAKTTARAGPPLVVDLGSGDGRVVIEAARRGYRAVGYEINPLLVAVASAWAALDRDILPRLGRRPAWKPGGSAAFFCRDLWTLDLTGTDVVFVYGLSPIMDRLSTKLHAEAPGAVVVSNVFEMSPRLWRKIHSSEEAHLYVRASDSEGAALSPAKSTAAPE